MRPKKRLIRHHVEYLASVAAATGVLNTIPKACDGLRLMAVLGLLGLDASNLPFTVQAKRAAKQSTATTASWLTGRVCAHRRLEAGMSDSVYHLGSGHSFAAHLP